MTNIVLKVHNDCKGKYQSFEAYTDVVDTERGYGADQAEAIAYYKRMVQEDIDKLQNVLHSIDTGKVDIIMVDYKGDQIQKSPN